GARDQPGRRSISGAEALPEQAHVVVERDAPVAAYAKGEIEPERNGRSLRVVRDEGPAAIVRVVRNGRVGKRRMLTHLDRRSDEAARTVDDRQDAADRDGVREAGAQQRQRRVVLREALGQPEAAADV